MRSRRAGRARRPGAVLGVALCRLVLGWLVVAGAVGCDKAKPAPPPPEMFDEPAPLPPPEPDPVAPLGAAEEAGAKVAAGSAHDPAHDVVAPAKVEPAKVAPGSLRPSDSLLVGPCPLAGEVASTCLREPEKPADQVRILHILIAWKGTLPGAPAHRDEPAASKLALELGHAARTEGMDFVSLVHKYSDDPGAGVYTIDATAEGRFVEPFIIAARRLALGSVDVIRSQFGFHVMKRVPDGFDPAPRSLPDLIGGAGCARCGSSVALETV